MGVMGKITALDIPLPLYPGWYFCAGYEYSLLKCAGKLIYPVGSRCWKYHSDIDITYCLPNFRHLLEAIGVEVDWTDVDGSGDCPDILAMDIHKLLPKS